MTRIIFALHAFWITITGKPHIYCSMTKKDYFTHSIDCTNTQFNQMMQHLTSRAKDAYNQQLCVEEAKEILQIKER